MHPTTILYPIFALAGWTALALLWLAITRFTSRLQPEDFICGESDKVPMRALIANRNYVNLLELPLLFYVVCLMLHIGSSPSDLAFYLAWAYVGLRVVHSLIYLTYNHVMHRFAAFAVSNVVLLALWMCAFNLLFY
ncbi:MAPEG family protein [Ampullimonas aquatilis]|uniref:MAPEG family protein n=1 Tax=Ampullimonas aquatilis TaxID=1341549 RepID=UPI003C743706